MIGKKIKSTRFAIGTADLAAAMTRMKLPIPQSPLFASLPVGSDTLSDRWVKGRKIKPELMAVIQALTAPQCIVHLARQTRYAAPTLETHVFSRTGKAPYVMAAPKAGDEWDIAIFSDKTELEPVLAGFCSLDMGAGGSGQATDPVEIALSELAALALIADYEMYAHAKAAARFEAQPPAVLAAPLPTKQLADLIGSARTAANPDWTSHFLMGILGPSIYPTAAKAFLDHALAGLIEKGLLDESLRLLPEGITLVTLLKRIQTGVTASQYTQTKLGSKAEMQTVFDVGSHYLMARWALDAKTQTAYLTLLPRSASSHVVDLMVSLV